MQREPLLAFILNEFERLYKSDSDELVSYWKKYCNHMNKNVGYQFLFYLGLNFQK